MNYDKLFNQIANQSSSEKKIEILKSHKHDELLKRIIIMTLDPFTNYWIKKIPEYNSTFGSMELEDALDNLAKLSDRTYTGYAAVDWLQVTLNHTLPQDAAVVERIIGRDLRCGVSVGTVNKVWPGLIKEFPVMLCSAYDTKLASKINFPAIVQKKEDGMRVNVFVSWGKVEFRSRSGKAIELHGNLEDDFHAMSHGVSAVYDGELLVVKDGVVCDRQTGNGILNKAVKGTISPEEASSVNVVLWDRIPYGNFLDGVCAIPYHTRLNSLFEDMLDVTSKKIDIVPTHLVDSLTDVQDRFASYLEQGAEGIILKDMNSIWENKRSRFQIKFKGGEECDLRCMSIEEGKGKYAGMIGALNCESGDGKLSVTVGSGLSDDMRNLPGDNFLDKIITVKYNQRIKNKSSADSLFLPIFVEVRLDKYSADNIGDIA